MRVTSNSFPNTLVDQLGSLASRQNRLQSQAATGQRIRLPEDDPMAMQRVINLQADAGSLAQYQRNIGHQQEVAGASYSALRSLKQISDRVGEIATLADGLKSPQQLTVYAREMSELIKQGVQLVNTKNPDGYLFAGTRSDQPPFVLTSDTSGRVASVTYQGNESVAQSEISNGVTITAQVPGANTSGSGPRGLITDLGSGADFFNHLIALQDHLLGGDTSSIAATDRAALARDEENLILHIGQNGALQSRLEASLALGKDRSIAIDASVSKEADADLAETLTRLSQTQTAYQAALQSAAAILKQSLMDYLR